MKILILADPSSPHTLKWVRGLAEKGIKIYLFGLSKFDKSAYSEFNNITIDSIHFDNSIFQKNDGNLAKIKYLKSLSKIKKIIKSFKPDIVHAYYATSYGLLGALSGFHPYIISVWGSDIYDFPQGLFINKYILKYNLSKADIVCSTSNAMALETKKYTHKEIKVIPFGIDLNKFKSSNKVINIFNPDDLVIGTVKTLEEKYGIEYLIRAFAILRDKYPEKPLKLLIVGGGSQEKYLKNLTDELNINQVTVFTGRINYDDVVSYYNELDIYVAMSNKESFGVAVIEASSCEKPVIVSNVGGLPEVVENNKTGFIVEAKNYEQAALAMEKLVNDSDLRLAMGKNGRKMVKEKFYFNDNLEQMIEIYESINIR